MSRRHHAYAISQSDRISSAGELICRRTLAKTATGFVPGQHEVRIIDPHPQRDRADLAAILTYVDDEGRACSVICLRYRAHGWRSVKLHRADLRRTERSTIVGVPPLEGALLAVVERAAEGVEPYAFREPSAGERQVRRLAHKLLDHVAVKGPGR